MSFLSLCLRNVLRRKQRSALTACAVAIAVAAVVALVGVSDGFRRDFVDYYEGVGVDLLAIGRANQFSSALDEAYAEPMRAVAGVADVIPGLADMASFPEAGLTIVPLSGLVPETMVFDHLRLLSGRKISKQDGSVVMIGATIAESLGKTTGDTIEVVEGEPFEIVGVFEGASVIENGTILISVAQLQVLMGREGEVTGFSILAEPGTSDAQLDRIIADIEAIAPGRIKARRTREHIDEQPQIRSAIAMAWITSAIAMVIGTLGMLNTMLMSLQERIGEIGLLRAVGWRRSRVARMILAESVLLSVAGGAAGVLGAIGLVRLLATSPAARGFISGQIDPLVLAQGMAVAVGVGIVGGIVPALSATRLTPAEALRH